jgi:hypothetical protein
MKAIQRALYSFLVAFSLNASADEVSPPLVINNIDVVSMNAPNILSIAPCKANGDGTYTEMITTMASVLPPEMGDALLAKYCQECYKRKFQLSQKK